MSRGRLRLPPSSLTGEVGAYLNDIWRAVNEIPSMSMFSGTNPNSSLSGVAGNIAINVSPASDVSRVFVKYGSAVIPDTLSWHTVA